MRIESGRGLIEEDQVRLADQREREIEAPPLTAGEVLRAGLSLGIELDQLDQLVDPAPPLVVAAVHLDQLGHRQVLLHAA